MTLEPLTIELTTLEPVTLGLISLILAGLVGALVGTAGFAVIASRQPRRIARIMERMAVAEELDEVADVRGINDPVLRLGIDALSERFTATRRLATIDQLTGLLNRQAILERLEDELDRASRYDRVVSVVLIDLDHFKRINDAHGHAVGDAALRAAATALGANVRSVDAVGRYGGEEFLLVLPETAPDDAAEIAEKLRRIIASTPVDAGAGVKVAMTLSAGVAGGSGGSRFIDSLIREADEALYAAKSSGRDQVVIHSPSSEDGTVSRIPVDAQSRERAASIGRLAAQASTDALVQALAQRTGGDSAHSTAIAQTAATLARALGLAQREIERIRVAGLLHDLGDLAIPEDVLAHDGKLGRDDRRMIAEHPKVGQIILEQAGALRDAGAIVLHHHERFDGRGYPHGLAGEEIPIGARIVAVIDAYDAMTNGRPYRAAISHEEAVAELRSNAGTQFDPGVVDAFVTLVGAGLSRRAAPDPEAEPARVAFGGAARRVLRRGRSAKRASSEPSPSS